MASPDKKTTAISLAHSKDLARAVQEVGMDKEVVAIVDRVLGPDMTRLLSNTVLSGAQLLSNHAELRTGSGIATVTKIEQDYVRDQWVLKHTMGVNPTHLTLLIGTEFEHVMGMSHLYYKLVDLIMSNDPRAAKRYMDSLLLYLAGNDKEAGSRPRPTKKEAVGGLEGLRQSILGFFSQGPVPVDIVSSMAESAGYVMSKDLMLATIMRQVGLSAFTYSEAKKRLVRVEPTIVRKASEALDRPTLEAVRIARILAIKKKALDSQIALRDNAFSNVTAGPGFEPEARGENARSLQIAQKKVITLSAEVNRLEAALVQAEHVELGAVRHSDAQIAGVDLIRGTIAIFEQKIQADHFALQTVITEGIGAIAVGTRLKQEEAIVRAMGKFKERLLAAPEEYKKAIATAVEETREAGIPDNPIDADYKVS